MLEREYDEKLNVSTVGIREQKDEIAEHHNRYEATPYEALDELAKNYKITENSRMVDFGCGRGRAMFYMHYHYQIPVKGIEANDKTFEEALSNQESYERMANHIHEPIHFIFGLAEDIEIESQENLFYFFNPFSLTVFQKVIYNILRSVEKYPRDVEIIFYYPLAPFERFLHKDTPFERIRQIDVPHLHGKHGKFSIYRYQPKSSRED